ncbi:MAG: hypothetical protein J7J71_01265 [Deltaproteobacteria bacterium]|nr:hypothetical protein [Candidatus Tharpella sp.]
MKTIKAITLILALFIMLGGAGCSNQDAEEEAGMADRITTKAAKKMSDRIRTPIDKAKATKSLGDERMKEMDKALKNQ